MAFRMTDINASKQTVGVVGIDKEDENNQKRISELENGKCLWQDLYGRVCVVQKHPEFEEMVQAIDTRPAVQRKEEE
ncbi:hypothetical protein BGU79_00250 [Clostridioides difficile]|nr:hypothetical protein BGU79_00250 [Clostridioides difficile]